jgi:hypothetical protein
LGIGATTLPAGYASSAAGFFFFFADFLTDSVLRNVHLLPIIPPNCLQSDICSGTLRFSAYRVKRDEVSSFTGVFGFASSLSYGQRLKQDPNCDEGWRTREGTQGPRRERADPELLGLRASILDLFGSRLLLFLGRLSRLCWSLLLRALLPRSLQSHS